MFPARFLALFLTSWLLSSAIGADKPVAPGATATDAPLVTSGIRELMQDAKYAEAVAAIDVEAKRANVPADYLGYLKGRALYLDKKYDEAVAAFQQVEAQFPQSTWLRRARFGEALSHARKGDFAKAEAIYRKQAEYLLSADRKQQIADIYLQFADDYFDPPGLVSQAGKPRGDRPGAPPSVPGATDPTASAPTADPFAASAPAAHADVKGPERQPDYEKALVFYTKALEVGPKPDEQERIELQIARCHQQSGRHDDAARLYRGFLDAHKKSPLRVEVRFRLGEVELAKGQHAEARRTWQDLLAEHVDSSSARIAEAMFLLSRTWQIPQPQDDRQLSLGVAALEGFLKRFPGDEKAAGAHLDIARSYIHRGRYEEAVASLKAFLRGSLQAAREVAEARNLVVAAANSRRSSSRPWPRGRNTW